MKRSLDLNIIRRIYKITAGVDCIVRGINGSKKTRRPQQITL
jgi:hypothetical protein